jgi:DNA-binding NtrC family response regulator
MAEILLIDDDADLRRFLQNILEQRGQEFAGHTYLRHSIAAQVKISPMAAANIARVAAQPWRSQVAVGEAKRRGAV